MRSVRPNRSIAPRTKCISHSLMKPSLKFTLGDGVIFLSCGVFWIWVKENVLYQEKNWEKISFLELRGSIDIFGPSPNLSLIMFRVLKLLWTSFNYSMVYKNCCMFEFPAFLPPTNLGLPMHSPSALKEHVSLNLACFFLLNPACAPKQAQEITSQNHAQAINRH